MGCRVAVEPAGLVLGDPDLNQVTADAVALGEGVGRLSAQELLDDLTLELDRMRAVLSHGLSPRKPGSVSRFSGAPKVFESVGRHFGVPDRVLNVLVPEVVLQGPRVVAIVGELEPARMAKHVWVDREWHLGGLAE